MTNNIKKLKEIENKIINIIKKIVLEILQTEKIEIKVTGKKDRVGASISSFLEEKFCEYVNKKYNEKLIDPKGAPKNKTKNPWDAQVYWKEDRYLIPVWIDFKAINKNMEDSNPDMGSADKIFNMIQQGVFLLLYVEVYYEIDEENKVVLDTKKIKVYFLHNISKTYRRTPTNQMQVNINEEPDLERNFDEFLDLHYKKLNESYKRELEKINKKLEKLPEKIKQTKHDFYKILTNIFNNNSD